MDDAKEYLIELVRDRKVLYCKGHKDFKDSRTIKRNNWEDVAKELATEHPEHCGEWKGKMNMLFVSTLLTCRSFLTYQNILAYAASYILRNI